MKNRFCFLLLALFSFTKYNWILIQNSSNYSQNYSNIFTKHSIKDLPWIWRYILFWIIHFRTVSISFYLNTQIISLVLPYYVWVSITLLTFSNLINFFWRKFSICCYGNQKNWLFLNIWWTLLTASYWVMVTEEIRDLTQSYLYLLVYLFYLANQVIQFYLWLIFFQFLTFRRTS